MLHGWMMVERFICHVCLYGARGSAFFEPGQVKGHRWQPAGGGGASAAAWLVATTTSPSGSSERALAIVSEPGPDAKPGLGKGLTPGSEPDSGGLPHRVGGARQAGTGTRSSAGAGRRAR